MRLLPILMLAACAGDPEAEGAPEDGAWSPPADYTQPGPFSAGTTSVEITGSTGVDLTIQVWYPSSDTDGPVVNYDGFWSGEALQDATAACDQARPVLLFSHGYGGIRWQSPEIVEFLATHGLVVIAPDHTGNTFLDNDDGRFSELLERRPIDLIDSYETIVEDSLLSGCIEPDDGFAVSGHSFGGYTAFAVGGALVNLPSGDAQDLSDPRVWAVAPLAPWNATAITDGTKAIAVPVMTQSGGMDETTPWQDVSSMHSALTVAPTYLAEFPTAGHYSFSPLACATGETSDGCGDDNVDIDSFLAMVNQNLLAFLASVRESPLAIDYRAPEGDELLWTDAL